MAARTLNGNESVKSNSGQWRNIPKIAKANSITIHYVNEMVEAGNCAPNRNFARRWARSRCAGNVAELADEPGIASGSRANRKAKAARTGLETGGRLRLRVPSGLWRVTRRESRAHRLPGRNVLYAIFMLLPHTLLFFFFYLPALSCARRM